MTLDGRKKSQRQERALAKRLGGLPSPGSGSGWSWKNDVKTRDLSIEAKYTDKKQYSLKQADLHKGEEHAFMDGKDFAFVISFSGEEWAVIRQDEYERLREAL